VNQFVNQCSLGKILRFDLFAILLWGARCRRGGSGSSHPALVHSIGGQWTLLRSIDRHSRLCSIDRQ